MGAKLTTSRNCVAIWCDKPVYYSGDIVQGYVLLNVHDPFAAGSVNVEIKGSEKTSWIHTHTETRTELVDQSNHLDNHHNCRNHCGNNVNGAQATLNNKGFKITVNTNNINSNTCYNDNGYAGCHAVSSKKCNMQQPERRMVTIHHRIPHGGKRPFFRVNIPLATFNSYQPLPPGQYQFPFRVQLPADLPGSFRYEDCADGSYSNILGKVSFKVAAEVVQGQRKGKHAHLHDSMEIVVRQRLSRPPSELTAETSTTVKACCFSNKGMVTVRLRADRDSYTAGETAYMLLEVDNHTDLSFPEVKLKVERVVYLRASDSSYTRTETVFKHNFPGLGKGESHVGANAQRLAFPVSGSLAPTTLGSLVKCSYRAWVEMSAGLLTNNPKLCVPLTIYATPPPHAAYAVAPPDFWKPQMVYPAVDVNLPSAPPLEAVLQQQQQQQQQSKTAPPSAPGIYQGVPAAPSIAQYGNNDPYGNPAQFGTAPSLANGYLSAPSVQYPGSAAQNGGYMPVPNGAQNPILYAQPQYGSGRYM